MHYSVVQVQFTYEGELLVAALGAALVARYSALELRLLRPLPTTSSMALCTHPQLVFKTGALSAPEQAIQFEHFLLKGFLIQHLVEV